MHKLHRLHVENSSLKREVGNVFSRMHLFVFLSSKRHVDMGGRKQCTIHLEMRKFSSNFLCWTRATAIIPNIYFLIRKKGFLQVSPRTNANQCSLSLSLSLSHTHRCSQCAKVDRRRRRIRINMSRSRLSCAPRYQSASPKLELKYTSGWASLFKTLLRSSACLVSATLLQT